MVSSLSLYFLILLDSINNLFACWIIVSCIVIFVSLITFIHSETETKLESHSCKFLKIFGLAFFILILIQTFIPTTKQALVIWGVPKVLDASKDAAIKLNIEGVPKKALDYMNLYLEKEIDKLNVKSEKK